ncbi:hypothetical protein F8388_012843 [Cannabis sativa]|uniref:chorismate synthase n=1 Tax=Cannabis sativa TaxID=3483 RepID=A0A7J6ESI0_CANSA|nr:hypothetical protein F8388_012843 [Cannabis sativa]
MCMTVMVGGVSGEEEKKKDEEDEEELKWSRYYIAMASLNTVVATSSLLSNPFWGNSNTQQPLPISALTLKSNFQPKKLQVKAGGSSMGSHFRVTTYGESHGGGVGCVIDGVPPRQPLSQADLQADLDRRRPDQSQVVSPRKETDKCKILSGVYEGMTTGTPINIFIPNIDPREQDYTEMMVAYRPSHADATYDMKYGIRSVQGGGRASGRETVGRVAAGAVAKKILKEFSGIEIESNIARCPNSEYAEKMISAIEYVRERGDSIGGVVSCFVRNCPQVSTYLTGSEHNDEFFVDEHNRIRTKTNRSGGIQGGVSNGEIINMRVAVKPTATIAKKQLTVTRDKTETELITRGRHDPCVVSRERERERERERAMEEAKGVVKHVLLAKFKEGTSDDQIQQLIKGYANLLNLIPSMKSFHWGKDVSFENLHQGFTHIFESTFENTEGVAEYVAHPAHVEFANVFLSNLDKVVVFDYKPTTVLLP